MVKHIGELHVVPLGTLDRDIAPLLADSLARQFRCRAVSIAPIPHPTDGWEPGRGQHQAGALLDYLERSGRREGIFLLGVTERDLWLPGLNFVFGAADAHSRVAVISLARLGEEYYGRPTDPDLFLLRACKEGTHELGHTLGLGHCDDPCCIMFFSDSLADTDRKGPGFCVWCADLLAGGDMVRYMEGPFSD